MSFLLVLIPSRSHFCPTLLALRAKPIATTVVGRKFFKQQHLLAAGAFLLPFCCVRIVLAQMQLGLLASNLASLTLADVAPIACQILVVSQAQGRVLFLAERTLEG